MTMNCPLQRFLALYSESAQNRVGVGNEEAYQIGLATLNDQVLNVEASSIVAPVRDLHALVPNPGQLIHTSSGDKS